MEQSLQMPWVNTQDTHPMDARLLGLPGLPHVLSHSIAGLRVPSCQEVPHTRLTAGKASSLRAPSSFLAQRKEPRTGTVLERFIDEFTHLENEQPERTKKNKSLGLNSKSRPTKPERVLCKSLARMVFWSHQASSLKDVAKAEKMLVRSMHTASADPRSFDYGLGVLHALFAEIGVPARQDSWQLKLADPGAWV